MKKATDKRLADMVKGYVKTLESVVLGNSEFDELADGADTADYNEFYTEYDRLRWYFEGVLDVEFIVDARLDYKGAIITLAFGGPTIELNTRNGKIEGYWGSDEFSWHIFAEARKAIDDYWAEECDVLRGC